MNLVISWWFLDLGSKSIYAGFQISIDILTSNLDNVDIPLLGDWGSNYIKNLYRQVFRSSQN